LRDTLARLAARFVSLEGWSRLGYARVGDYARERLGTSQRTLQDFACVGARLEELPALHEALVSGWLPWSKVRLLARFLEAGNEAEWIAYAARQSVKVLERELRAVDRGALEAGALDREQETAGWLRISAPMSLAFKWQRTKRLASQVEGAPLSPGEVLERVMAEVVAALPVQLEEVGEGEESGVSWTPPSDAAASGSTEAASRLQSAGEGEVPPGFTSAAAPAPTRAPAPAPASSPVPKPAERPAFLARLLEGLEDADAFELDARLRQAIRLEQRLDAHVARLVRAVMSPEYEWKGERPSQATLARDYLGMSPSKLQALLRIERVGELCPVLREAYRDGALSWVQADALAPLLDSDAEGDPRRDWRGAWVAFAQGVTGVCLKQAVERARFLHEADPEVFERHREDPAWFALPLCDDENESGASGKVGKIEDADAQGRHDRQKCAHPTQLAERGRLTIRATSDVARLFRAVLCTLRRAIERETGRLPDEAEAFEAMLAHALESWGVEDPWLKRNMSRKYRAVLDRDGWRCVFPGCTSQRNLHVHHIRFRSAGGGDEAENLTTLCAFHHLRGVHGGTVSVQGSSPDGLEFALGLRAGLEPLARYRSGDRVVA
jgi:hypothetical protein